MKKMFISILILIFVASIGFMGVGCKEGAVEEEVVEEAVEAVEEEVVEEAVEEKEEPSIPEIPQTSVRISIGPQYGSTTMMAPQPLPLHTILLLQQENIRKKPLAISFSASGRL